jgi:crotonobetainyl-CoA:carnitine CoA-transferase CaiB-like acyl-CoA transferase
MVTSVQHAQLGKLTQLGVPFRFSACGGDIRRAPPMLGEHTDKVLSEILGRSAEEIAALHAKEVI